jgi:hypothetical protein
MIIVDFLTLRMPGMLNRLSIFITYQKIGEEEQSISFEKSIEWQNQNLSPFVGLDVLPREIILPGLLFDHYSLCHFL